jgi:hypothetical protein
VSSTVRGWLFVACLMAWAYLLTGDGVMGP